jgi:hypothetical protein
MAGAWNSSGNILPEHIRAADFLRHEVDLARLGRPSAARKVRRVMDSFDPEQADIILHVVLENQPVARWAKAHTTSPVTAMRKLIDALDLLVAFYAPELTRR